MLLLTFNLILELITEEAHVIRELANTLISLLSKLASLFIDPGKVIQNLIELLFSRVCGHLISITTLSVFIIR